MGGLLAYVLVAGVAAVLAYVLTPVVRWVAIRYEAVGVAIGASLMTAIGIIDDLKGLTAPAKLAAQIFAASIMTLAGVQVLYFWVPSFGTPEPGTIVSLSPDLGVPLTVLLVVITVNAVNLVDGLDGLAAGLVGIGALAYFIYSYRTGAGDRKST